MQISYTAKVAGKSWLKRGFNSTLAFGPGFTNQRRYLPTQRQKQIYTNTGKMILSVLFVKRFRFSPRYNKTVAQLFIRWSVQSGFTSIPKSSNEKRIVENSQVFDWRISYIDMKILVNSIVRGETWIQGRNRVVRKLRGAPGIFLRGAPLHSPHPPNYQQTDRVVNSLRRFCVWIPKRLKVLFTRSVCDQYDNDI